VLDAEVPLERLGPFLAEPRRAAILTDFDGTLAGIVEDPAAAVPLPGAADVLGELARRYGRVGIISGRPAAFLDHFFGRRGLLLFGLYGLESVREGRVVCDPAAERWRPIVEEVAAASEAHGPGEISVERKGLSVTFHYRATPETERAAHSWAQAQATASGLVLHPARMSYELRPPIECDKGTVTAALSQDMDAVCFIGDDRGDLTAFDALDRIEGDGRHVLRVAVRSAEAPPELIERADLLVPGPAAALSFLRSF
jgi:trehalose 6-phosphate phosphatase